MKEKKISIFPRKAKCKGNLGSEKRAPLSIITLLASLFTLQSYTMSISRGEIPPGPVRPPKKARGRPAFFWATAENRGRKFICMRKENIFLALLRRGKDGKRGERIFSRPTPLYKRNFVKYYYIYLEKKSAMAEDEELGERKDEEIFLYSFMHF